MDRVVNYRVYEIRDNGNILKIMPPIEYLPIEKDLVLVCVGLRGFLIEDDIEERDFLISYGENRRPFYSKFINKIEVNSLDIPDRIEKIKITRETYFATLRKVSPKFNFLIRKKLIELLEEKK